MKNDKLITESMQHTANLREQLAAVKKLIETQMIVEGVDDPGILKCIFMAGGPGSGKTYTAMEVFGIDKRLKASFASSGLKSVNSDTAYSAELKRNGIDPKDLASIESDNPELWQKIAGSKNSIRSVAKTLTAKQKAFYEAGRLGMIIDGTGHEYSKIEAQKRHAESLGYDTYMVFVNTSLEVAKLRNLARGNQGDRVLPDELLVTSWKDVQNNLGKFQALFGGNFRIIDNTSYDLKNYEFKEKQTGIKRSVKQPIEQEVRKAIDAFVRTPINNPIGKQWITTARMLKTIILLNNMDDLTYTVGNICNQLEDAIEESDWRLVKKALKDLDKLYESLEKPESGWSTDY